MNAIDYTALFAGAYAMAHEHIVRMGLASIMDPLRQAGKSGSESIRMTAGANVADYASERAAELVGMKWVNGQLVQNPAAEWAISESTRTYLRQTVTKALKDGMTKEQLRDAIMNGTEFSEYRASMVAKTELSLSNAWANFYAVKAIGGKIKKRWILSADHGPEDYDECDENAAAGDIDIDEAFPSGDMTEPAHPHDECDVAYIVIEEESGDEIEQE